MFPNLAGTLSFRFFLLEFDLEAPIPHACLGFHSFFSSWWLWTRGNELIVVSILIVQNPPSPFPPVKRFSRNYFSTSLTLVPCFSPLRLSPGPASTSFSSVVKQILFPSFATIQEIEPSLQEVIRIDVSSCPLCWPVGPPFPSLLSLSPLDWNACSSETGGCFYKWSPPSLSFFPELADF